MITMIIYRKKRKKTEKSEYPKISTNVDNDNNSQTMTQYSTRSNVEEKYKQEEVTSTDCIYQIIHLIIIIDYIILMLF